jgi:hypothetical protein
MEWIQDNLQIIIAAAAAVAYWLNQRRQAQMGDGEEDRTESPQRDFNADPEEAERTRRIQEEIRRKIAERAGGGPISVPLPAPEPPPLFRTETSAPRPVAAPLPQREFTRQAEAAPLRPPPTFQASAAAILERQQQIEEQMRELEAARKAAQRRAASVAANTAVFAPAAASGRNSGLLADLHGARNLRRAIVLREILGPPVGLR